MKIDRINTVAAIMAHPDDEVLGCGATLSRFAREGCNTHILILATGLTSMPPTSVRPGTEKLTGVANENEPLFR